MLHPLVVALSLVIASHAIMPVAAEAQSLGAFRWQLQPYCNVLTLTVTQSGGAYRLEGTDDQCGSARAAAIGMAFQQLDGTIGLGLTIVGSPDGSPVHIDAKINLATLGGTWRDSAGHTGARVHASRRRRRQPTPGEPARRIERRLARLRPVEHDRG